MDERRQGESILYEGLFSTARLSYIMRNPTIFLDIAFHYDAAGLYGLIIEKFPDGVDTEGKVIITICHTRNWLSRVSGPNLLNKFKKDLEIIYTYIEVAATSMAFDIVAKLTTKEGIPLAYFYQGEYHLWEK